MKAKRWTELFDKFDLHQFAELREPSDWGEPDDELLEVLAMARSENPVRASAAQLEAYLDNSGPRLFRVVHVWALKRRSTLSYTHDAVRGNSSDGNTGNVGQDRRDRCIRT